jgi:hypothetical protein
MVRLNKFTVSYPITYGTTKTMRILLIEISITGNVQQNPETIISERFTTNVLLTVLWIRIRLITLMRIRMLIFI